MRNYSSQAERSLRLVCISPFFAPLANAEAFCGGKLIKELLREGLDVTIISVDYSGHKKFTYDRSQIWDSLSAATLSIPPHGGYGKHLSIPLGLRYQTHDWSRWIEAVMQQATRMYRDRPFDVIYSRSLPNVAHVAGYWLAVNLRLPWIANFNDPWDLEGLHLLPQEQHLRRKGIAALISDWWLQRVMSRADVVTFPCVRLRDYHLRLIDFQPHCAVIPHIGFSTGNHANSKEFRLMHVGNLGSGESTRRGATLSLLLGLQAFLNHYPEARPLTRLILVGNEDHVTLQWATELKLDGVVVCTGRVSYEESLEYIASGTVCLLVEGKMPEGIYLPSKLADYMASKKPVIALSPGVGTIADFAELRGISRVDVDDAEGIEKAITLHYEYFRRGTMDQLQPENELVERFSGRIVARRFRELLKEMPQKWNCLSLVAPETE